MIGEDLDFDELITYLKEAVDSESLVHLILYAHLLIERAITRRISDKLVRPEILKKKKYGRWSFHQKIALYVGLLNPPEEREERLRAFNELRNKLAHGLEDETKCVRECLSRKGEQESILDVRYHVLMMALELLEDLGAINPTKIRQNNSSIS